MQRVGVWIISAIVAMVAYVGLDATGMGSLPLFALTFIAAMAGAALGHAVMSRFGRSPPRSSPSSNQ
jgi:hypothetical protein